jgi:cyclic pyranopterin phosphate synthase
MSAESTGLVDRFGRRLDYLRISVTERCDLRCAYCCPQGARPPAGHDLLTSDNIADIARAALGLGIRRLRLTGGETTWSPSSPGCAPCRACATSR